MGRGIGAVIPLTFKMDKFRSNDRKKYFTSNFFDFYTQADCNGSYEYTINKSLFLAWFIKAMKDL